MHRAFFTNPHNPKASTTQCRLCGCERESIAHFGKCASLKPAFRLLREFDGGSRWDDEVLNLFGQSPMKGTIKPGVSLIHFIVWKFIIIHMTQLSIEGKAFRIGAVLDQARSRVARKINTAKFNLEAICMAAEARSTTPKAPQYKKWIGGIGGNSDR